MKDSLGKALYSYWKGDHRTPHIIRRDDGFVERESLKYYFRKFPQFPSFEKKSLKFVKGRILDIGCGAGRHVLYLQKRGFDTIGIDSSPLAVKVCRGRGCKRVQVMDIFKSKFRPRYFDTILLLGNNIGIGGTLNGAKKLLEICRGLASDDGILILTTADVKKMKEKAHKEYYCNRNERLGKYIGTAKFRIEYKNFIGDWFNWIHLEEPVLRRLASKSGWKIDRIFKGKSEDYAAVLRAKIP